MPRTTTNGKHSPIPDKLDELGLNLRSYLDLPPRATSLEDEVKGIISAARTRTISPEEATRQVLRIIGREQEQLESALKRAITPGQLWADGCSSDHE